MRLPPCCLLFALILSAGCAEFANSGGGPSSGRYNSYPNSYPNNSYNSGRDYRYERELDREREELDRERQELEEERRRINQERKRATPPPAPQPPTPPPERCPAGFSPSENKCSKAERREGCKDIRLPGGLGCVSR